MRRCSIAVAIAALVAAVPTSTSAQTSGIYLRLAANQNRHVVAVFTLSNDTDLTPGQIAAAVRPNTEPDGAFVAANVRLKEDVSNVTQTAAGERVRTRRALRPGVYYVKVSATVVGLDCTPLKPCRVEWSNARRVRVPRPT